MLARIGTISGIMLAMVLGPQFLWADATATKADSFQVCPQVESVRLAIKDLIATHGASYPRGPEFLARLDALKTASCQQNASNQQDLAQLQREALLLNPLLDFDELLLLKRRRGQLGLPVNHKCNAGIEQTGYDNEIAVLELARPDGPLRTLFRPPHSRFVGEIDLHWDAERLLLTMPHGGSWQIHEIAVDGSGLRQLTPGEQPGVDNFDGCYLPDDGIVFASTASFHAVPCWHGVERACSLYRMDADGGGMRQLCFDQDLDLHPAVLPSGQVIYSRWDYSGPMHMYLRPLMVMNPDGTGQRAVYGSNSYWPNALYFPRGISTAPNKIVTLVAGYHGVPRMGELSILDIARGWHESDGVVQQIPNRGKPIDPIIRDNLVDKSWPKFLHPYPLSDKYFLVAVQTGPKSSWGIYLVDVFDNMVPLCVRDRFDFFEPIPLRKTPRPPVIPDRVDLNRDDAFVYLHDVYAGPGLAGVPRETIKRLRIVAYHFGYPGLAGPDKIGCGGPWEAMRILGTVPVYEDGSASFRVPANTPLTIQPLDAEGKAVQLMRSWYTAMPGESVACVGCHEQPRHTPLARNDLAARLPPVDIEPWYGPPRGFDFEREVQPVLDAYCVACHDGRPGEAGQLVPDLRAEHLVEDYRGRQLTKLGSTRLHPDVRRAFGGTSARYTPAYEALIPYIRRVNIEDDVNLLVPGEYHADTSELVQMLQKGHYGVRLDDESWDRLITWIDLNGPCHGSWTDVCTVPDEADQRRQQLANLYGGPRDDPEKVPALARPMIAPVAVQRPNPTGAGPSFDQKENTDVSGWPFDALEARRRQSAVGPVEKAVELGHGLSIRLVRIPAGVYVMGSANGKVDERPRKRVSIERDFWIGASEITNAQFASFDTNHTSGRFAKRFQGRDGPGLSLDSPSRPVVRVSWERAVAFCEWLSRRTGARFTLPSESQWEYACRAGTDTELFYGTIDTDFSAHGNFADAALSVPSGPTGGLESNITAHHGRGVFLSAIRGGNIVCDARFDDGAVATAEVGSYEPNAWGLSDMHGNVAEWTRSSYRPYADLDASLEHGRPEAQSDVRKVVRGGSWVDRPKRCRSAFRLSYPAWQRVHNVGFRVVCEDR